MKIRLCPKCGGEPDRYTEFWSESLVFHPNENGIIDKEGFFGDDGDPYCVEAKCSKCEYAWKLSNITSIDNLRKWMNIK